MEPLILIVKQEEFVFIFEIHHNDSCRQTTEFSFRSLEMVKGHFRNHLRMEFSSEIQTNQHEEQLETPKRGKVM